MMRKSFHIHLGLAGREVLLDEDQVAPLVNLCPFKLALGQVVVAAMVDLSTRVDDTRALQV